MSIDKYSTVWYKEDMISPKVYTPEQVAQILQLSKNTIYGLISRGEIVAKKIGNVYRIPASSIFFAFTGLDEDVYQAEQKDREQLPRIQEELSRVRTAL